MVQFSTDDLRTPESLERVLRQFQSALVPRQLTLADLLKALSLPALADLLAPFIRNELQAGGTAPLNLQSLLPSIGNGLVLVDTHANRLALYNPNNYQIGQLFYETDRTVFYMVTSSSSSLVWSWKACTYSNTLANLPADLATNDAGFLFEVTDYDHILQWTGSAWTWAPGEIGSGYYAMYEAAPNSIGANSWQACDGSTVARLNADGTTTNVTTPNLATAAYLKGATAAAAVAAASGLVAATTATNQNTVVAAHAVVDTLAAGSGNAAFSTPGDAAHTTHTHIQNAHDHGPGTLELRNKQTALYYRR